jgi:LPXTG-motif cell wall-anchored protein
MRRATGLLRVTTVFATIAMMTLFSTLAYGDPTVPASLPSSGSSAGAMPLVFLGFALMSIGGVLLRRGRPEQVPTG